MFIHRRESDWVVQAPAKLNLFFEVLAKRGDGYHEIETLMCPINLYDTLFFTEEPNGQIELTCQSIAGPSGGQPIDLPQGRENLVWRAVDLLRRRAGLASGAKLRLIKRIPTQAGLGGGSSDAAAALAVANAGWDLGWPPEELMRLAGELGSDVPFFLAGGWAICRGRGEQVERLRHSGPLHVVVICPPTGLATAAVYAVCRPAARPESPAPLLDALGRGDFSRSAGLLFNRLQPAAETLSPWIGLLRDEVAGTDCLAHAMSGSGSAYYSLCRHARHARRIARRLRAKNLGRVFSASTCH
jgi:4-diphosphocytidyl-2-C-methyl-D-erythritol kinase